jgi:hypothetical protein
VAVEVCREHDAVARVDSVPDVGRGGHTKLVEQFPDEINCVTLHLVGYTYIRIFLRCTDP